MQDTWYYEKDQREQGPVAFPKLQQLARSGVITPTTLVWKFGMVDSLPAGRVPGLFSENSDGGSHSAPRSTLPIPDATPQESTLLSELAIAEALGLPSPDATPQDSSPVDRVIGPGYRFNDRYIVERELGQGGMGKVFLARDEQLGRHIAIKVIRPQDPRLLSLTVNRQEYSRAFLEEAKVGAELDHPNIAKVFDFGIDHGEPFTVFEYVEGETLKDLLARRGRLPLEEVQDIVAALAQGLAYAHARHIVHRDLKPANIRITPEGVVKILDLGLAARFREQADWHYCGTPAYITPEQAASKPCDGRTDQYALAVIAFEMVTGELPFKNPNIGVLLRQHRDQAPPDPRELVPDLPNAVAAALLRALAKKPEDRFDTCDEFAVALGCQVVRRGAELPQFIRLASLSATSGTRLSAPNRGDKSFRSKSLYVALASDGLYVWYREEATRWALTEVAETKRKGATLTLMGRDGKKIQSFTFAVKDSCAALDNELQKLLANRPNVAASREPRGLSERRSVFLLLKRVWFTHQTLGTVSHQGKSKQTAQVGVQIQAHLLGADAVAEVETERLPTFFNTGYRCSGVAIRAVDQEGRLQLGAHWLEQRARDLSGWMLGGVAALAIAFFTGVAQNSNHILKQLRGDSEGLGWALTLFLVWIGVPGLFALILRTLRWPQLVKPTAGVVAVSLLGLPLFVIIGSIGTLAELNRWLLTTLPLVLIDRIPLTGLFSTLFVLARTRQFLREYQRLLTAHQPPESGIRLLGQRFAWGIVVVFVVATVGVAGIISLGSYETVAGSNRADVEKDNRARELFQQGYSQRQSQPDTAEKNFHQALALFEELHTSFPSEHSHTHMIARTHFNLGSIAYNRRDKVKAEQHFTEARNLMELLVRDWPNDPDSQPYPQVMAEMRQLLADLPNPPKAVKPAEPQVFKPVLLDADLQARIAETDFRNKMAEADRLWEEIGAKITANPLNTSEIVPLCKKALTLFEALAVQHPQDRKARMGLFSVYLLLGHCYVIDEKSATADEMLGKAQPLADRIQQEEGNKPEVLFMLTNFQATRGKVWLSLDKVTEAENSLPQALASLRKLLKEPQPQPHWKGSLPVWLQWQAEVHRRRSRWAEATACLQEACAIQDKVMIESPNSSPLARQFREELRRDLLAVQEEYADAEVTKGEELRDKGKNKEAMASLELAQSLYTQLAKENPKEASYRHNLGICYHRLGETQEVLKQSEKADTAYRLAIEVRDKLVAESPDNREYRRELAQSHWNLAELSDALEQRASAARSYENALELYAGLSREQPTDTSARWFEAACQNNVAWSLEKDKKLVEASNGFRQAAALWEKLAADYPKKIDYRIEQARSQKSLVRVLRSRQRLSDVVIALRQLAAVRRKLVDTEPGKSAYRDDLAQVYQDLAAVLKTLGRWEDAVKEYREAVLLREQLVRENGKDSDLRWSLAAVRNNLALALQKNEGQKLEAEEEFRSAAEVWAKLADDFPDRPAYKYEQARTLNNLVDLLRGQPKRLEEATKVLYQVEVLRAQAAKAAPDETEYAVSLGETQAAAAQLELDQRFPVDEVLHWCERATQTLEPHLKDRQFGLRARETAIDAYRIRAKVLTRENKYADAISAYDRILDICSPADRPWNRGVRAWYHVQAGDRTKAAQEAEETADEKLASADTVFLVARVLALAAARETDTDKARGYTDRALVRLRQAVAKGYNNVESLKNLNDLNALRARKEFQALVKELEDKPKE